MRRFRLRRLWRVNCEALMRTAGQNLKRLLNTRGWGRRPYPAEAVSALCLASCAWMTHPFLEYWPFPSLMRLHYLMDMEEDILLPDELCQVVFQQADILYDMLM